MLKGLSRLWLRAVKRAGKAQLATNKKLVKSLLSKKLSPVKAPRKTAVKTGRTKKISRPANSGPCPGRWLTGYYTAMSDHGVLPMRRMLYWLYLPDSAQDCPLPLVVMLHGCQQSATEFSEGTRMNQLAEKKGFAVLYPQQSLRAHRHRCWHWYDKTIQDGGGEASLIVGVVKSVQQKYVIDPARIYIAGLSAGAAIANIVALNYPEIFAAVGLHSAPVFGAGHSEMEAYGVMQHGASNKIKPAIQHVMQKFSSPPLMPAMLIHGQSDSVVRSVNQTQLALQFRALNNLPTDSSTPILFKAANRASMAYKTHNYYEGKKLMLSVCSIIGLDHAWSGGDSSLLYNSSLGPDASKMMWNFFARHRRPDVQN